MGAAFSIFNHINTPLPSISHECSEEFTLRKSSDTKILNAGAQAVVFKLNPPGKSLVALDKAHNFSELPVSSGVEGVNDIYQMVH